MIEKQFPINCGVNKTNSCQLKPDMTTSAARLRRLLLAGALALGLTSTAHAQGTGFTYQGRLDSGGVPYSGTAEFQPTLWNLLSSGMQLAANSPAQLVVAVTNGLFVLPLDFGASFPGTDRWLQLEAEPYTRNLWCSWQSVQPMAAAKRWVMPILRLSAPGGPSPRRPA